MPTLSIGQNKCDDIHTIIGNLEVSNSRLKSGTSDASLLDEDRPAPVEIAIPLLAFCLFGLNLRKVLSFLSITSTL